MADFYAAANAATNGREVFRSVQAAAGERKAAAVRHIAPICESWGRGEWWGGEQDGGSAPHRPHM